MALHTKKLEVIQQWDDGLVVRRMRQDEGLQVIEWFRVLWQPYPATL